MHDVNTAPTEEQVTKFTFLSPMLDSALAEMREFAKRKQDGIVSTTKIKILNRLLSDIKLVVEKEDSADYLDLLSEEELPQNSDAVLVLGQYRAALNSFKARNYKYDYGDHRWITKEWLESNQADLDNDESDEDEYDEGDDPDA